MKRFLILSSYFLTLSSAFAQSDSTKQLQLKEVEIKTKHVTRIDATPMNVEVINSGDLKKDACCTLSESFENSATVDVTYSDAVSGAKEIRMLGLDGAYTQIMVENITSIRSLGNTFGLNYVPGPWMNSIQVNKGAGSVVNGYEGMTGQINVEYKKPQSADKLFVNLYMNQDLRTELNIISAHKFNSQWSYMTAAHGTLNLMMMDFNRDHFLDNPLVKNLNVFNRFVWNNPKGGMAMLGVVVNVEDRIGGSKHFNPKENLFSQNDWGTRLTTGRVEVMAKTGFQIAEENYLGIQYKYIFQKQSGYVGRKNYYAREHFGYVNTIFQHEIAEKKMLKAGLSFQTEYVSEVFDTFTRKRMEIVPGAYAEGDFNWGTDDKVMLVAGVRGDYHNLYGVFLSPRVNLKWNIRYDLSLRVYAGRGYRVPTIFAENYGYLANSREIIVAKDLGFEEAWNYGASLVYKFFLDFREGIISVDYYRTDFTHQVVADLEDVRKLKFYNLSGKSFANAVQVEVSYEVVKNFDIKLAYKFEQNKIDYADGRKIFPLRPQHRGLVSLQYTTKNDHWKFNTGLNWFGKTRIPDTSPNDLENQRTLQSKDWFQLNAQITYKWKQWEVYVGGENLVNFIQKNPIISNEEPFSNQFDASLVWGPLRGAQAFAGFRFSMN